MQQVNVKFNNVNQIRQFVDIIDKFDSTLIWVPARELSMLNPYWV